MHHASTSDINPLDESTTSEHEATLTDRLIIQAFARLDGVALGIALGTLFGFLLFLATIILVIKGGDPVGPHLSLLSQFLVGYSVTLGGSLIGMAYGFGIGFVLGGLIALLHNLFMTIYLYIIKFKASLSSVTDPFDPDHSS